LSRCMCASVVTPPTSPRAERPCITILNRRSGFGGETKLVQQRGRTFGASRDPRERLVRGEHRSPLSHIECPCEDGSLLAPHVRRERLVERQRRARYRAPPPAGSSSDQLIVHQPRGGSRLAPLAYMLHPQCHPASRERADDQREDRIHSRILADPSRRSTTGAERSCTPVIDLRSNRHRQV
jgi:hypothetical protein